MAKPKQIQSLARGKKINMMIYGRTGIGKTTLIGTTPGKTLILRPPVEHTDSIRNPPPGLEEWVLRDWAEAWEALDYLRAEGADWDWVWLDSISLWQDIGLDDIWETVVAEKPARQRYGLDKSEYGVNMFRLAQFIRHVVGSGIFNFGVTAHPADLKDAVDGEADEKLMPFVQGKNMSPKICGYMNVVGYLDLAASKKNPPPRVLRTNANETYYAKDQYDALKDGKMIDPTMPKLLAEINKARPKQPSRTATKRTSSKTRRTTPKGR